MLSRAILVACVCVAAGGAGESDALAEIVAAGLLDPGVTRACQRKVCAEHVMGLYSARLNSSIEDLACVVPGAAAKIHGNN